MTVELREAGPVPDNIHYHFHLQGDKIVDLLHNTVQEQPVDRSSDHTVPLAAFAPVSSS